MLKNHVGGQSKCVLIIDHIKVGRLASKLVSTWADRSLVTNLCTILMGNSSFLSELNEFPVDLSKRCPAESVIFMPVQQLCSQYRPAEIFQLVHKLKHQCKQVFLWASPQDLTADDQHIMIPFLVHMSTVVVTLIDSVNLAVLTKKPTGSIVKKNFSYTLENDEFLLREVTNAVCTAKQPAEASIAPESLATFKINCDDEELVARNALKLPYERTTDELPPAAGRIIYNPDSDDDFDEEDPDDDLDI